MGKNSNTSGLERFAYGTIPESTIKYANCAGAPIPMALYLTSTNASREIAISTDGVNYFVPSYDASPAAFISVAIMAPIHSVRFTGAPGDAWGVR